MLHACVQKFDVSGTVQKIFHRIFAHMHGALNVVEKITNYTV